MPVLESLIGDDVLLSPRLAGRLAAILYAGVAEVALLASLVLSH